MSTLGDFIRAIEKEAQNTLSCYLRYQDVVFTYGPEPHIIKPMDARQRAIIYFAFFGLIAIAFTWQGEILGYKNIFKPIMGAMWLSAAFALVLCGLINSYTLVELFPATRIITLEEEVRSANQPNDLDRKVDRILGRARQTRRRSANERTRRLGLFIMFGSFVLVTTFSFIYALSPDGDWFTGILTPILFLGDLVFGTSLVILPPWVHHFFVRLSGQRKANRVFQQLCELWSETRDLYIGATHREALDNPGVPFPAVSPLPAYFINHQCHRDVRLPAELFGGAGITPGTAEPRKDGAGANDTDDAAATASVTSDSPEPSQLRRHVGTAQNPDTDPEEVTDDAAEFQELRQEQLKNNLEKNNSQF